MRPTLRRTPAPGGAPRIEPDVTTPPPRSLIDTAHDGIFVSDAHDRVELANPALAAICGRPVAELVGMPVADLVAPQDLAAMPLQRTALQRTGRLRTQRVIRRPDGTHVHVEVGTTVLDGGRVQCIVRDVTARHRAEELLRASEGRLRGIFDGTFEFVGLLTPDGTVLEANRAALAFGGVTADAVVGRRFWDTVWWSHSVQAQAQLRDAVVRAAAGEFVRFDVDHRGADGRTIVVDFSLTPIRGDDGAVALLVPEGRDVTDERRMAERLRESEETFRLAFEHSSIGMALVGLDGRWRRVNRALCNIVGYTEAELLARTFQDITHPDDLEEDLRYARDLAEGRRTWYELEKRYVHKDGHAIWVLLNGSVLRGAAGEPRFFIAQVQDVSARKEAEAALERQRAELARSNAELEQFAHVASHDLQEPLRAVASYTDLLGARYAAQLDDRARKYIRHAADGAHRMQALIRDLLALSRVGTEGRPFVPVSLGALVDDAIRAMEVAIAETGATVTRDALPVVVGDPAQLGQLVQNLLANALKFRRPGVPPCVHFGARKGDAWTVAVRDNGIGIDARFAERVFQVFQRLHTRDEYPGTGMGLAICKKVVDRHGGRIWVEPRAGGGSVFCFTLPKPPDRTLGEGDGDDRGTGATELAAR